MFKSASRKSVLGFMGLLLVMTPACSSTPSSDLEGKLGLASKSIRPRQINLQFPDLPFPPKHKLDRDRTFVYESGQGEVKVAGIQLLVPNTPSQVRNFYRAEMKDNDWRMLRMIDHSGTAMLYESSSEICTITLKPEMNTTRVFIEIGPK